MRLAGKASLPLLLQCHRQDSPTYRIFLTHPPSRKQCRQGGPPTSLLPAEPTRLVLIAQGEQSPLSRHPPPPFFYSPKTMPTMALASTVAKAFTPRETKPTISTSPDPFYQSTPRVNPNAATISALMSAIQQVSKACAEHSPDPTPHHSVYS